MALVTVLGANASTVTLNYDRLDVAAIANNLAAAINAGILSGAITPAEDTSGPPPTLSPGQTGEWVQTGDGVTSLSSGYRDVAVTASNAVIFGSGDTNEAILSSTGNLSFFATGGSGTVAAGAGNNRIIIPSSDSGNWGIYTGNGDDTVLAAGSGNDTIAAGSGHNSITLGPGNDLVQSSGDDTVLAGSGSSTIVATGQHSDVVYGASGPLTFIGSQEAATVLGGTGSVTVFGGSGPELLRGGTNGDNLLYAGNGTASLFGAGPGDTLFASGSKPQLLTAGAGNETLFGGYASGNDTFVGGTGSSTITAGSGNDQFVFTSTPGGAKDLVIGFTSMDKIDLVGYGPNAVADALKSQTVNNGSVTITLNDHTQVTFSGVTSLSTDNFVTPPTAGGGPH
jgi:Ca2+-binding RTX toxin-like protein